jgi:endonuclease/exonuclease/phosphatase family metal-dependent hydrolase
MSSRSTSIPCTAIATLALLLAVAVPAAAATVENRISGPLRVLSLNVAHGRKDALNQTLLDKGQIERNLGDVAALLREVDAHVVALQEADGPSRWSGGFDHVARLAEQARYPWHARGSHAKTWAFDYGTALLSRVPLTEEASHAFPPSPPSMTKGMMVGQVEWQPAGIAHPIRVDVVSVHLDFSRDSVRKQQVDEMAKFLSGRTHPVIVLGDFNSDWFDTGDRSVVTALARRCDMQAYEPHATDLGTFPSSGKRLDWVLISGELEFLRYQVLPQLVSDHKAVVAEIGYRGGANAQVAAGASRCSKGGTG